jgi:hypothetical protein
MQANNFFKLPQKDHSADEETIRYFIIGIGESNLLVG